MKRLTDFMIDLCQGIPDSLISLLARIGLFSPFFFSGLSKTDQSASFPGNLLPNENTIYQFVNDFGLPFPELSAYAATIGEVVLPILLVIGLATRFSALALIVMVVVINIVDTQMAMAADWYAWEYWKEVLKGIYGKHALWLAALLILVKQGAGVFSLDFIISKMANSDAGYQRQFSTSD